MTVADRRTEASEDSILHIDADRKFCELTDSRLRSEGFSCDSLQAAHLWQRELVRGRYRLVLLDLTSGVVSGLKLLQNIKEHDESLRVIVLTSRLTVVEAMECLRLGADYCFFKPLENVEGLIASVHESFRRSRQWKECLAAAAETRRTVRTVNETHFDHRDEKLGYLPGTYIPV